MKIKIEHKKKPLRLANTYKTVTSATMILLALDKIFHFHQQCTASTEIIEQLRAVMIRVTSTIK